MDDAVFFQSLSDETRLRIIMLLACAHELPVCHMVDALGLSQPKISRHLAWLRDAGLVAMRRQAQWVHYRLDEDMREWKMQTLITVLEGLKDKGLYAADRQRLQGKLGRPVPCRAA